MTDKKTGITRAVYAVIVVVLIIIAGSVSYYYITTTKTSTTTSSTLSGSITVAAESGYNDKATQAIAADFMKAYPGTTVNVATLPYSTAMTSYEVGFSTNESTFDVVFMGSSEFLGLTSPYLLNLKPYLSNPTYFPTSYNVSDIIPASLPPFELNGGLYGLPMELDTMALFYRPSAFNNATNQQLFQQVYGYALPNPGKTTLTQQQVIDIATFFNGAHGYKAGIDIYTDPVDDDMVGSFEEFFAIPRVQANTTYGSVSGQYGTLFSSDGRLITNTSLFINALSSYDKILGASEQPLSANFGSIVSYFSDGDAPMLVQYTYPMFYLNSTSIGTDWAVAPTFPGGHSIFGGQCWSVFKYTKNLPLALAFVRFATSASESNKYMTLDGLFPFRYSQFPYASTYLHISPQMINTVLNLMSTSIQGDNNVPYGPLIGRTFAQEMALVYFGTATPAQAANVITSTAEEAGAIAWTPTT